MPETTGAQVDAELRYSSPTPRTVVLTKNSTGIMESQNHNRNHHVNAIKVTNFVGNCSNLH